MAMVARSALPLAERIGLFESAMTKAMAQIQADLDKLIAAPLHEGLRRLQYAAVATAEEDRLTLLREARAKFDDAAARELSDLEHVWALLLVSSTWSLLGSDALAREAAKEALIAADNAWF